MLCSKLNCQKVLNMKVYSYKIPASGDVEIDPTGSVTRREIDISLPNNQCQCPYVYVLVTVPRVSRSRELCPDGFDIHLLHLLL